MSMWPIHFDLNSNYCAREEEDGTGLSDTVFAIRKPCVLSWSTPVIKMSHCTSLKEASLFVVFVLTTFYIPTHLLVAITAIGLFGKQSDRLCCLVTFLHSDDYSGNRSNLIIASFICPSGFGFNTPVRTPSVYPFIPPFRKELIHNRKRLVIF
jgi:hypothetical protein